MDLLCATARDVPPPDAPLPPELSYFWQGFGLVDEDTVADAVEVLRGGPAPVATPWPEWWYEVDRYARGPWGGTLAPCEPVLFSSPFAAPDYADCVMSSDWDSAGLPPPPPA